MDAQRELLDCVARLLMPEPGSATAITAALGFAPPGPSEIDRVAAELERAERSGVAGRELRSVDRWPPKPSGFRSSSGATVAALIFIDRRNLYQP